MKQQVKSMPKLVQGMKFYNHDTLVRRIEATEKLIADAFVARMKDICKEGEEPVYNVSGPSFPIHIVGGAVLDMALRLVPKDFDFLCITRDEKTIQMGLRKSPQIIVNDYYWVVARQDNELGSLCDFSAKFVFERSMHDLMCIENHFEGRFDVISWMESKFDIDIKMLAYGRDGLIISPLAQKASDSMEVSLVNSVRNWPNEKDFTDREIFRFKEVVQKLS